VKIAAPSADLLIKVAIGGVVVFGLVYLVRKITGAAGDAVAQLGSTLSDTVNAVNPLNNDNVIYQTANGIGGALVSDTGPGRNADGSWTFGGWIYDVTH
jgi:hypothetical protein